MISLLFFVCYPIGFLSNSSGAFAHTNSIRYVCQFRPVQHIFSPTFYVWLLQGWARGYAYIISRGTLVEGLYSASQFHPLCVTILHVRYFMKLSRCWRIDIIENRNQIFLFCVYKIKSHRHKSSDKKNQYLSSRKT